jgi:tRNA (guanine37-N1)-methyltransferase
MLNEENKITLVPFDLKLDYDYWTYHDIMSSILPEAMLDDIPSGFQIVGHVAHLNLRDHYLPYKQLIANVILDKNSSLKTVINKIDTVGEESQYRTFSYEVLAGPDDMEVELKEQNCMFRFNYAKVYWNSRLNTEHERLVQRFRSGTAICDVMAGIGPFALPAGKNDCFVWANDLNPESYAALKTGIKLNKVGGFVQPFNEDGHTFIRTATTALYNSDHAVTIKKKQPRTKPPTESDVSNDLVLPQPKFFSHFVMNLPASALSFLPSFVGLYSQAGIPASSPLPVVHVHCFSTKSDDNKEEAVKICKEISDHLGYEFKPGDGEIEGQVEVFDVRDVAPNKRMFCASFRLPQEVAYR